VIDDKDYIIITREEYEKLLKNQNELVCWIIIWAERSEVYKVFQIVVFERKVSFSVVLVFKTVLQM
jgi:hypothetical protein